MSLFRSYVLLLDSGHYTAGYLLFHIHLLYGSISCQRLPAPTFCIEGVLSYSLLRVEEHHI